MFKKNFMNAVVVVIIIVIVYFLFFKDKEGYTQAGRLGRRASYTQEKRIERQFPSRCMNQCSPTLMSESKKIFARLLPDGNLQIQDESGVVWQSNSANRGRAPYNWHMQQDGNVVIYDANRRAVWASGSHRRGTRPYELIIEDGANLVAYGAGKPIWSALKL